MKDIAFFLQLVQTMRTEQIKYFATRKPQVLKNCKHYENRVDQLIREYYASHPVPNLFNG